MTYRSIAQRSVVGLAVVFLVAISCMQACTDKGAATTSSSVPSDSGISTLPLLTESPSSRPAPWSGQMLLVSDGDEGRWLVPEDVQAQVIDDLVGIQIALQLTMMLNPSGCQLSNYYLSPELDYQQELAEARRRGDADIIVDGPGRMHTGILLYCTQDGWECLVVDRITGGTIHIYDSATGRLVEERPGLSVCQFIRMRYDDRDGRWKIAEYGESYEVEGQTCP